MINDIYEVIKEEFEGLDAVYEDSIIHQIGIYGLNLLKKHKLVEACGVVNGRQLYALCVKEPLKPDKDYDELLEENKKLNKDHIISIDVRKCD